jgi:hypothetical protein
MRSHMNAGQDGFRDPGSKQHCDLKEGHWVYRSVPRRGSIDHTICSLSCKFWQVLAISSARLRLSCSPGLADPCTAPAAAAGAEFGVYSSLSSVILHAFLPSPGRFAPSVSEAHIALRNAIQWKPTHEI